MTNRRAGGELRRAFVYLAPYWRRLVLVMVISLVSTVLALVIPYLTKGLVDEALLGGDLGTLQRTVALFAGLGLVSYGLNVVSGLRYTRVSAEILFDMRLDVYRHLQRLSPRFYARTRLGDIVARLNSDIGEIQRVAAEAALAWVGNILFLTGCVAMMVWLDWRLTLVTAAIMPFSLAALVYYRRRLEARVGVLRQASADIGSFLIETLQAHTLVATSNAGTREVGRFRRLNDRFIDALMGMQRLSYLAGGLPGLVLSLGAAGVLLYGGWRIVAGTLTLGTFAAFVAYQMRVMAPVQALMGLYTAVATARVSWRRVLELLDAPVDVVERDDAHSLTEVRGALTFDRVSLVTERGVTVLDEASFDVAPGTAVAIVGASGSGKSTMAALVLRLLDPDSGVVRLDGHDLRDLRLSDVRRHVTLVEQEPTLLHASIAENLQYGLAARDEAWEAAGETGGARSREGAARESGEAATGKGKGGRAVTPAEGVDVDAAMRRAAAAAGVAAFVEGLPQGYDTVVGERGWQLSAGERQRLALARAFLANPAVLVLDEPTAALDPVSERAVVEGYRAVMRGRTTLIISHRREVALAADRVIVLDGARVAQVGAPHELLDVPGPFARLFGATAPVAGA